ncbi:MULTISPECIES: zinc-binding dehydrogenase [unclassified Sphingomonas]|uniref:zinc-binding dehydrogenase n=1 Tax=unclassified Sphingomonas TaxID=196159 RepID=UPI0006F4683A|nr:MULTISPECIES: zinc-binding dehydrogenase [unclassified Sphingomonas]KQX24274.1 alcohol dehydrogenase [Sphingomonas sp. Root1294]KQY69553.1 alcohol dehydrogenase [Sphingomonas sp. Root50]KRB87481.1 alcohol dehydrogenase [Sphingomonas sp. Root720]
MRALVFDRFGGPDVLEWREIDDPVLRPGSALVRIASAGLNFADIYRRRGNYLMDATPPWILGYEGAGEIAELSEEALAAGFRTGDRVGFADSPRANAELVAVPVDKLIRLPDDVGYDVAAALLLQGLTAQYLVSDSYEVKESELAVVHAAAGGVGLLLTQMLAAEGAQVAALASSVEKREAAIEAGAMAAFGYEDGWPSTIESRFGRRADVVFESVGSTLRDSLDAVRIGGAVVFYGFAGGDPAPVDPRLLMDRSLTLTGGDLWNILTGAAERRRRAQALFELLRAGKVRPTIAARVPMMNGREAHELLESRAVVGKVLLTT